MSPPIGGVRAGYLSAGKDAIPDARNYYSLEGFTTTNWPDSENKSDITTISGLTFDYTAFNDTGGVSADASNNDYGQSDTMGPLGSELIDGFAISIPFETTDSGCFVGAGQTNSAQMIQIGIGSSYDGGVPSNSVSFDIADADFDRLAVYTDNSYNDGNPHHLIVNKTGNTASDIDIYIDDMSNGQEVPTTTQRDETFDNTTDLTVDMTYFANNNSGSLEYYLTGSLGPIWWRNGGVTDSERMILNNNLEWT